MRRFLTVLIASLIVAGASAVAANAINPGPTSLAYLNTVPDEAELTRLINVFEGRLAQHATSVDARNLGGLYLQRGALDSNVADYRSAYAAYRVAVERAPSDMATQLGLASAAAHLHRFSESLSNASMVAEAQPQSGAAHLLIGDAHLELGNIDAAQQAFTHLPAADPATLVRAAEIAHLSGDQGRAIEISSDATRLARDRGLEGRVLGFYLLFEADLLFDAGRYEDGYSRADEALRGAPDWAPAHAATAKLLTALGEHSAAISAYHHALVLLPGDPGWMASLADLHTLAGDLDTANALYSEAERLLADEDEVLTGRSLALLWADRGIRATEAVALAEADLGRRQDIGAWDTVAWAQYRAGNYTAARAAADRATASGAQDGELWFHSAVIWAALGDSDQAAAELNTLLQRNPEFHPIHAVTARAMLDALES